MDKFSLDRFNERKIVTQDMLNSNGTLFGGYVLSWMDLIGHRMAIHITKRTMFTAYADKIKFKKPAFLNDEIEIRGTIKELGGVKLVLLMEVVANPDKECQKVVEGIFTFVELDNNMRPTRIHYPSHSN